MDVELFKNSPTGKLHPIGVGEQQFHAFVPAPLPQRLEEIGFSSKVILLLTEAERAFGELRGMASLLPELLPRPELLIVPQIRREAVASIRIEGTQITEAEAQRYEVLEAPPALRWNQAEVESYVKALDTGLRLLTIDNLPICIRLIRKIHQVLMEGIPRERSQCVPGEFRHGQVIIGRRGQRLEDARFIPPPAHLLEDLLADWETTANSRAEMPLLILCALLHYQFETIHPFDDGNGRVGRLLIKLFLHERDALPYPILFLSGYLERNRREYLDSMLSVSRDGDWQRWLIFFLQGIVEQSQYSTELIDAVVKVRERYRQKLQTASVSPTTYELLDLLFEQQTVTAKYVTRRLDVTVPTAQSAIEYLLKTGILVEDDPTARRNRSYTAEQLLRFFNRPEEVDEIP